MSQTATIEYIDVNGIRTAYATEGDGFPVMMLHGWGSHINLVWPLATNLAQKGLRVIVPDLPGFGDTPAPPTTWTVHDYAAHVLALMDALGVERAHLFGHSFGGRLSIVLGAEQAARFDKIVLCDAAGVKPPVPLHRQIPVSLYHAVKDRIPANSALGHWLESRRMAYRERTGSTDYLNAGALRETFLAVIQEDLLPTARHITRPTLLVWGANDTDTPLWQAHALEKAIPDAGLVTFPNAGHYSYLDALPNATQVIHYFYTHNDK